MYIGGKSEPDFIAELKYLTTEEGGRTMPAHSGYRPHVKFPFSDSISSGEQVFIGKEKVKPGESVTAKIALLAHVLFAKELEVGQTFEFLEGARLIGRGTVIEVINEELKKPVANKS